ncbi:hypothetical protein RM553_04710 [Zunongwangia sp. F363]|uniref:Lipoprotein n=1 Tax=Autumnicola tepida TaxID=3075595 RepID=A0ABU3C704_9FLAO|nr:hypothetical protein [Zunongwangia sp. F363]MDT0642127.1 hypothetical protein [Zunongwangia sp. F363]
MKKLSLLLVLALTLVSCNDDDGENIDFSFAEITGEDLPEYFELGEEYEINVTYELPDACHTFYGFNGQNFRDEDDETVYVYEIVANTSYDPNETDCDGEGADLTETKTLASAFKLGPSFQYETVRFKFLTGVSETNPNEGEYMTVDVPVGAPDDDGEDTGDDTEDDTSEESSN